MNYLGDWGKQFGLLAVGFERYGSEKALSENAIMHLFNVYVSVNRDAAQEKEDGKEEVTDERAKEFFKRMEAGDEEALKLWRRFRELSIEKYDETYRRLNVQFDVYAGESLVGSEAIAEALKRLHDKNLLVPKTAKESKIDYKELRKSGALHASTPENDASNVQENSVDQGQEGNAWAVDLNPYKLGKPVVQKPDGTTIYIVRDIAGAIERYQKYKFDKMIYVVGDQQDLHVAQFFKILSLMQEPFAGRLEHVNFGRVNGMSTRKGEVKFLEDILDAAKEAMMTQMQKNEDKYKEIEDPEYTSDQIGMTAVKIQDMQSKRINSYNFDLNRMTSFEGDTGPYLQYAHARLCSVERKVAPSIVLPSSWTSIDTSLLTEPKAHEIILLLATYPDVVRNAFKTYEPSTIVTFCFRLSHLISSAYEILIVKGAEEKVALARLYMYVCAREVLHSAMKLLSLVPLERM